MIFGDYHTHSTFSKDGRSSIEENVKMAIKKGLKQIAVTEHSFSHQYGIRKNQLLLIKEEIERLKKKYKIDILLGMEVDLLNRKGDISLPKNMIKDFDVLILSYHKSCTSFKYFFPHLIMRLDRTKKGIEKNTDAYIKAMQRFNVNIIGHLQYGARVNVQRIAMCAKDTNKFVELNGHKMLFKDKEIENMIEHNVRFIIDSDAHEKSRVGYGGQGLNAMEKYNIPVKLVANYNRLPNFKY